MIPRVKGTQDFLDQSLFRFVITQFEKHVVRYRFQEIATPIIEHAELFKRSLGLFTDVVSKEMFLIQGHDRQEQQAEGEQLCLRPELTAPTMRAFIEAQPLTPWKVFSHGPIFRYERPQKGRYRQFHQINCEVIGAASIANDALLITMLDRFFHETLKLNSYALHINFLGSYEDRAEYSKILAKFVSSLSGICDTCLQRKEKNILRIFDCKNPVCQKLYAKAPTMIDYLSPASQAEWQELQDQLSLLSVTFAINPRLVRGLDYYNKTVFEFSSDALGAQNAFTGGGRYDRLSLELGAKEAYPSLGAAIGIERLMLLLEPIKDQLSIPMPAALSVVMPLSKEQTALALLVTDTLHAAGIVTDCYLDEDSLKSMLRRANKMGASYALLIGDQEQAAKSVLVKNLMTSKQELVRQVDLVRHLK